MGDVENTQNRCQQSTEAFARRGIAREARVVLPWVLPRENLMVRVCGLSRVLVVPGITASAFLMPHTAEWLLLPWPSPLPCFPCCSC
jgi:hypothetical protein